MVENRATREVNPRVSPLISPAPWFSRPSFRRVVGKGVLPQNATLSRSSARRGRTHEPGGLL